MSDTAPTPALEPEVTPEPVSALAPDVEPTPAPAPQPTPTPESAPAPAPEVIPAPSAPAFDIQYADDPTPKTPAEEASATKPKYLVIGDKLYCQTPDGEIVLPLRFKTKLLREVNTLSTLDETEQLYWLLNAIGDATTTERLDELDVFDTLGIVGAYFQEFEKRSKAAMGESSGSLNS